MHTHTEAQDNQISWALPALWQLNHLKGASSFMFLTVELFYRALCNTEISCPILRRC